MREVLAFFGPNLIRFSYTPTAGEIEALERLRMTPKTTKDPQIRHRRHIRTIQRIVWAQAILSCLLVAIRENSHAAWLRLEVAAKSLGWSGDPPQKDLFVYAVVEAIGEARQELSRIRGFGHLAPGWRDHDTKGGKKKDPRRGKPLDSTTVDTVRIIAASLKEDLESIDERFRRVDTDRVIALLTANTTIENVAGHMIADCGALGYKVTTPKERQKLIANISETHGKRERERKASVERMHAEHQADPDPDA
ncbi:hypothetical protein [Polyangium sp. y55x31]|uniref:hypothetical protein n=1 Tax=Polyangium sp. y55x31 TaxID=3042688 RepID=UPI0024825B23|nr:hypothetical protein [Polyangium sp. y55x31]MDI1484494.1 hypothetical protein [Polyangium sp. y55x31]